MSNNARRDENRVATLLGVSNVDELTPVPIFADPVTNELFVTQSNTLPTSGNNPSLTMSNTDTTVASTKVLTETIGAVSYTSTLSYNAAGDFLSMTSWSQV